MTDERISPLRRRMIEDMSLRHFAEKTQKDYIRAVKTLTIFLGRSPGHGDSRGFAAFPIAPDREPRAAADHQLHGYGAAFLFAAYLAPLHKTKWYVYGKRPFGGPKAVLAYLLPHCLWSP
jgi:hypothetical protein